MDQPSRSRKLLSAAVGASAAAVLVVASTSAAAAATPIANAAQASDPNSASAAGKKPVQIEVFAPERHANAGSAGKGWFVDMELDFPGGPGGLHQSGFSDLQVAIQLGARAGGSQGPVVKSSVRIWYLSARYWTGLSG